MVKLRVEICLLPVTKRQLLHDHSKISQDHLQCPKAACLYLRLVIKHFRLNSSVRRPASSTIAFRTEYKKMTLVCHGLPSVQADASVFGRFRYSCWHAGMIVVMLDGVVLSLRFSLY